LGTTHVSLALLFVGVALATLDSVPVVAPALGTGRHSRPAA